MHHIMFDIDGTLVQSYDLDSECFISAVKEVVGVDINSDWSTYANVTDAGILNEILESKGISDKQAICKEVKSVFIQKIKEKIILNPVREIAGASLFLQHLKSLDYIALSFATGGSQETATLKLLAAGIDFSGIPIASSNDHFKREEIMKIAASRAIKEAACSFTYFGDGSWDKKACEQLGFNFVLVGSKIKHQPNINYYKQIDKVMTCIGL